MGVTYEKVRYYKHKYGSQKGTLCDLTPLFIHVLNKEMHLPLPEVTNEVKQLTDWYNSYLLYTSSYIMPLAL